MEYEKSGEKFSFGFGSAKTAGAGNLSVSEEAPNVRTKYNKKNIAMTAVKAAAATGLVLLRHKVKKRKK